MHTKDSPSGGAKGALAAPHLAQGSPSPAFPLPPLAKGAEKESLSDQAEVGGLSEAQHVGHRLPGTG